MEIHKPKPAHSIREFLIEIGTIICGIVIALGLEQGLDQLHWREKTEHGRASSQTELERIYLYSHERVSLESCLDARLKGLSAALLSDAGAWRPLPPMFHPTLGEVPYFAPFRPWPDEIWKTLIADGTANHLKKEDEFVRMVVYSEAAVMRDQNGRETEDVNGLRLLGQKPVLNISERNQLAGLVEKLRGENHTITAEAKDLLGLIESLAPVPTENVEKFDSRSNTGRSCRALGLLAAKSDGMTRH
jgi:hypothetical protein